MKTIDLTKGSIIKGIIYFMIPLIIGNIFQQAYSLIDAIIVGQTLGNLAFAGVGATGSISFLIIGFASGLTSGLAIPTSQYFGAKDYESLKKGIATSLIISLFASIILTIIGIFSAKPLLELLNTSSNLMDHAYKYLLTVFAGIITTIFYNLGSFILRSLGDSNFPLIILIIASLLNIGFDFLFISGFKMGTEGAGIATVLSQLISCIIIFIYLFIKFPYTRLKLSDFKFNKKLTYYHLKISLPMAFQLSIIAIGLMIQQGAVNNLDNTLLTNDLYATTYSAASKIDNLACSIISAFGTTMATFMGQNYGAKNLKRIKEGFKISTIMGLIVSIILALIIIPFGSELTKIFLANPNDEIKHNSFIFLTFQSSFYFFLALIYIYRSGLQGLGNSLITVIGGIIELIMRILASIFLTNAIGWIGLSLSNPLAWIAVDILLLLSTFYYIKKYNKEDKEGRFGLLHQEINIINKLKLLFNKR